MSGSGHAKALLWTAAALDDQESDAKLSEFAKHFKRNQSRSSA